MSHTLRFFVHLVFAYTCIEGFVVNVTYPNVVAYIVKDFVIFVLYLGLVTEQRPSVGTLSRLGGAVLAFAVFMLFFLVMPTQVSFVSALVALKQRLFYIPLMYVGYFYTRSERDMYGLVKLMAWTAIPTGLFGIYLFFAGPRALQALGGTYSAVFYSTVGASGEQFWRVPGTFTSPGQFALYLLIQSVVLTGILFVPDVPRRLKFVCMTALALSLAAMLASGSRTPLVVYVLCIGVGLSYMGRLTRIGSAAVVIYAAAAIAFTYFGAGVQDRVGSVLSQENYDRFSNTAFGQLFLSRMMSSPIGLGLGAATIAGRHFTDFSKIVFVESYFGVIAAETGVFGVMVTAWLMFRTAMLLVTSRLVVRRASWNPLWVFVALLVLAIIGLMPSSAMIDSAPGNMYFWFLIGMAVRLVDLERIRLAAPNQQPVSQAAHMAPSYAFGAPRAAPW